MPGIERKNLVPRPHKFANKVHELVEQAHGDTDGEVGNRWRARPRHLLDRRRRLRRLCGRSRFSLTGHPQTLAQFRGFVLALFAGGFQ
jgi:hypothetical protein